MLPSPQILDRGRLLLGLMLVAPLGTMVPAIARPDAERSVQWSLTAVTPNPISANPSPADVLANLTSPTIEPAEEGPTAAAAGSAVTTTAKATSEVGSESADTGEPAAPQIAGTPPDAALAAKLRASQSRFIPVVPSTPPAVASNGSIPIANPTTPFYAAPQGATHVFPVVGGASFTNDWGGPRPGGRSHQGIDLFAGTGTPIVAISDGTLFKVGWNRVGGWRFWLRDRWGNEFYHAHLSGFAPAAKEGAVVRAGTVIGFVGNTGDARTTPPHVHFEIHPGGGDPIPPFLYVSGWPRL